MARIRPVWQGGVLLDLIKKIVKFFFLNVYIFLPREAIFFGNTTGNLKTHPNCQVWTQAIQSSKNVNLTRSDWPSGLLHHLLSNMLLQNLNLNALVLTNCNLQIFFSALIITCCFYCMCFRLPRVEDVEHPVHVLCKLGSVESLIWELAVGHHGLHPL